MKLIAVLVTEVLFSIFLTTDVGEFNEYCRFVVKLIAVQKCRSARHQRRSSEWLQVIPQWRTVVKFRFVDYCMGHEDGLASPRNVSLILQLRLLNVDT